MAPRMSIRAIGTQFFRQRSNDYSKENLSPVAQSSPRLSCETFQVPLDYPRYKKQDYEKMEEWKLDQLLREYGLVINGSVEEKRAYAMGAFLWPDEI
ncbi:hypothetical protein FCM35_KLT22401 [Carex littledalei]|uniref:DUF7722 domain-containing protein n=1 Tax=Carex littledalei TaxID=544730 RepID=A0A833QFS7_9POAL|nr:hypothetical protein FCM35_KLT22401 [Carex littledalei]